MYKPATHGMLAELVVSMYKNKFICACSSKNIWYEFVNHRWREADHAISLKRKIYEDIRIRFKTFQKKIRKQEKEKERNEDSSDEESNRKGKKTKKKPADKQDKMKMLTSVINSIESPAFLNGVIEMCKIFLHDPLFLSKLDKNRHVIGCENGVLDLKLKQFREGRPDDYVSKSTNLYYKDYVGDEPEVIETEQVMHKVYPNEYTRQFIYNVWSMSLGGRNHSKMFIVSTGPKNAGKSGIHELYAKSLGEYVVKGVPESIQRGNKNSSGSARPEMMRLSAARAQIFDEISDSRTLDIDAIKRQTGNDVQWYRGLFDTKGEDIKPMYVTFLQCNAPPKIPTSDEALWFRMKVVPMVSQFLLSGYPETEEEQWEQLQFPADPNFDEKIPKLAPVLLWKIFRNYSNHSEEHIEIPDEVIVETNLYKTSNDLYEEFVFENMEKQPKNEKSSVEYFVSLVEVFAEFKEWYRQNCSKNNITRTDFKREMNRILKAPFVKNGWKGWRMAQNGNNCVEEK